MHRVQCTPVMSISTILGYTDSNEIKHETPFTQAIATGGIVVLDQSDCLSPELFLMILELIYKKAVAIQLN